MSATEPPPEVSPGDAVGTPTADFLARSQAFLSAIHQDPEDDAPRLIYADWLEEHGDAADAARAQFIRAQCALAQLPPGDPRRPPLKKKQRRLWVRHRERWLSGVPRVFRSEELSFQRGFLDTLTTPVGKLLAAGTRLLLRQPVYRLRLAPAPTPREAAELAAWPPLRHVRHLDLSRNSWRLPDLLGALLDTQYLQNLHTLDLADAELRFHAVAALAGCPNLPALRTLLLARNPIGTRGAQLLAESPHWQRLERLDLRDTGVGDRPEGRLLRERFGARVLL